MLSRKLYLITLALVLWPMLAVSALAQLGTTGITGLVADSTGAAIAQARVTAKNKATGQTRETVTTSDGVYRIAALPPAIYEVRITASGFKEIMIDDVSARVGETLTLNATLRPASVSETVDVKGAEARGVDTATSQVAGFISVHTVEHLPLNGRNFLDLAFLLPGNSPAPNFDPTKNNTIEVSSAGQQGRGGNLSVDGADNNDEYVGGTLQNLPLDAVREFQIITNRFGAEIGRSASSAINVVTRSGSNEFHGAAGFFFRNARLSALPATLDRGTVHDLGSPPFRREQYTGALGGPIKKDRAWFFTAFEYRDQDGIVLTGVRDTKAQHIVNSYSPAPLHDFLLTGRADWQTTMRDRMAFRYALQDEDQVAPGLTQRPVGTANQRQQDFNQYHSFVYNWGHTFSPRVLNDFVFQENHFTNRIPEFTSGPELLFPSIADGGNFLVPQNTKFNRLQFRDHLSWIVGAHALKFGGEFQRQTSTLGFDIFGRGTVILAEDFATIDRNGDKAVNDLDIPIIVTLKTIQPNPSVPSNNNYFAFYAQDDWKVRRNLTLNIGLRYDLDTNSKDTDFFKQLNPIVHPFLSGNTRHRDKNNFGPRFGFNWAPGDGRTSIHGGYGIYYDRTLLQIADQEQRFDGRRLITQLRLGSDIDDAGKFLAGTPTLANPFSGFLIGGSQLGIVIVDNDLESGMIQQFNFGFQRELKRDLVLSVDGLHTFGNHFLLPRFLGTVVNPATDGEDGVLNIESSGKNWYDGLLVSVEKRHTGRFGFLASYTLSKAFSYANDELFPYFPFQPLDPHNLRLEKGPTVNDQRHRFTFASTFDAPWGFQLSPILTIASSVPFDILLPDGTHRVPLLQRNAGARQFRRGSDLNAFIRQVNSHGGIEDVGPLPLVRDDLKLGDRFSSLDLRVSKRIKLGEKISLQGIAEVFNLFNTTNIRGFQATGHSGFQNVLSRDSQDPKDSGFLRSSAFGTPLQTAGGVFGTGGPRAFQFAARITF